MSTPAPTSDPAALPVTIHAHSWLHRFRLHIRVFFSFIARAVVSHLEFRVDFLAEVIASLCAHGAGLITLWVMFNNVHDLHQDASQLLYSKWQVLFIYGVSFLSMALFSVFSFNIYRFADKYIVKGEYDRVLVRPLNPIFQILIEAIDMTSVPDLFLGFGVIWYSADGVGFHFTIRNLVLLGGFAVGGAMTLIGIFTALSALAFWFEAEIGILPPVYNLAQFGRWPLKIYNKFFQVVLTWILPVAFIGFFPAAFFMQAGEYSNYALLTPLVGLACMALGVGVFKLGTHHYTGAGG
ncbi:MAG: ABC transporter permease [Planctomycetota bacterium]